MLKVHKNLEATKKSTLPFRWSPCTSHTQSCSGPKCHQDTNAVKPAAKVTTTTCNHWLTTYKTKCKLNQTNYMMYDWYNKWSCFVFHPDKLPWSHPDIQCFRSSFNLNVICCFRCFASCHYAAHLRTCSKGIASPLASFSAWIIEPTWSLNHLPPVLDQQKSLPGKLHSHHMLDHNEQNEFGMVVVINMAKHPRPKASNCSDAI